VGIRNTITRRALNISVTGKANQTPFIKLAAKYPTACCGDESGLAAKLSKRLKK
jgi:hypothetical protein